ncbi:tRNA1(Val) (adenine(37)-N6)-methyltransferase [Ekhidna sp.]|uniref:tRNA1(Val) (adenine(37)-N6)-methyltransferase n=1 Tax=Ekhidna sp. TaxID=2608089 RepID=UPI003B50BBA9
MPNTYFQFKKFRIDQARSGMKVTTDACLFGGWIAQILRESKEPKHMLDIGVGTGLLSVMLGQVTNKMVVDAVELNESAYAQAKINFENSPWSARLNVHHSSIQQYHTDKKYDLIVCNPPFFNNSTKGKEAAKNIALHNENLPIEDLVNAIKALLAENGRCYVLYPEREMNVFTAAAIKSGLNASEYLYLKNEKNHPVFRVLRSFSFQESELKASEVIIRKEDGKYTDEFWDLLKDYYLEYNNPDLK